MKHGIVRALLVLSAVAIAVRPARAGGPEPSDRSFGVQTKLPAQLTVTVTDHGQTCGLAANSTATWVLRAQSGGTQHVLCARNDDGSSIDFPMCDDHSQPALRCSTNQGGVQGMSESTLDPFGDLARWMQFKLYPQTIAAVLDGAVVSVTVMANGCQTLMPNGQVLSCASDADCVQTCNFGFCTGNAFDVSCTTDSDCDFGTCLLQGVNQLDFTDGTTDAAKGTRADYSLTLGFTPGVMDQGTCQMACASDPGLACQSDATCVSTCAPDFSCNNDPSVLCFGDQDCNFGSCVRTCSNDHTVACTTDTDCNLVINIGNVPVTQDAACAGVQCGDGFVDPGEQCDDGPLNGTPQSPSSCSCSCTLPTTTTTTTTSTTHSTSTSTSSSSSTSTSHTTSSSTSTSSTSTSSTSTSSSSTSSTSTSTSTSTSSTSSSSTSTSSTSTSSGSTSTSSTSSSSTSTSSTSSSSTSTSSTSSASTSTSTSTSSTSSTASSTTSTFTISTSTTTNQSTSTSTTTIFTTSTSSSSTSTSSTSSSSTSTSSTSSASTSTSTSTSSTSSTASSTTSTFTISTSTTTNQSTSTSTTTIFTTSTATTSTSITVTLPTTTTLPATCQVAATFESIDCRLEALRARIISASDVGRIRARLLLQLGSATTRKEQAEMLLAQGKTGKARAALRRVVASMADFGARVTSPTGRRQIGRGTRQAIAEQGKAIRRDLQRLLRSQAAKTPRTVVVSR